ncbi:MAG: GxxExxY protein [Rhodospirillales bacterium]|nr:GxxExxY protein [Rhodospirillales bacterium]
MKPQIDTDQHRLNELSFIINGCAMSVLNTIGHGFHEKIYENALAIAFDKRNLQFSQQKQFPISFEGQNVGIFIPDFVIEDQIILELKTIDKITNNEKGQVLNYLRASKLSLGIILNFKHAKLDWQRIAL